MEFLARPEAAVARACTTRDATCPGRARGAAALGIPRGGSLTKLEAAGVIRRHNGRYYLDAERYRANRATRGARLATGIVVILHLAVSLVMVWTSTHGSGRNVALPVLDALRLEQRTFFAGLFLSGVVLYSLLLAMRQFDLGAGGRHRRVVGAAALSVAVSILLAADAYPARIDAGARTATVGDSSAPLLPRGDANPLVSSRGSAPPAGAARPGATPASATAVSDSTADARSTAMSLWDFLFALVTQHRATSALALVALATVILGGYYAARSLLSVEYEGAGIQIRLPGQTVHYIPLYPQMSWQNTGIELKEGDKYTVEISGHVSPGALGQLEKLEEHMQQYVAWARDLANAGTDVERHEVRRRYKNITPIRTWAYSTAAGYPEEWYTDSGRPEFLKGHPLYGDGSECYYTRDTDLTVMGLPHNNVVGMIKSVGEPPPHQSDPSSPTPAYDYSRKEDYDRLILLSSSHYPLKLEARRSGVLWAVVNDVDVARWDNAGMFFLKVTRASWI